MPDVFSEREMAAVEQEKKELARKATELLGKETPRIVFFLKKAAVPHAYIEEGMIYVVKKIEDYIRKWSSFDLIEQTQNADHESHECITTDSDEELIHLKNFVEIASFRKKIYERTAIDFKRTNNSLVVANESLDDPKYVHNQEGTGLDMTASDGMFAKSELRFLFDTFIRLIKPEEKAWQFINIITSLGIDMDVQDIATEMGVEPTRVTQIYRECVGMLKKIKPDLFARMPEKPRDFLGLVQGVGREGKQEIKRKNKESLHTDLKNERIILERELEEEGSSSEKDTRNRKQMIAVIDFLLDNNNIQGLFDADVTKKSTTITNNYLYQRLKTQIAKRMGRVSSIDGRIFKKEKTVIRIDKIRK